MTDIEMIDKKIDISTDNLIDNLTDIQTDIRTDIHVRHHDLESYLDQNCLDFDHHSISVDKNYYLTSLRLRMR